MSKELNKLEPCIFMSLERILRGVKKLFAGGLIFAAGCGDTYNIINTPPTNFNQNTNYNSNVNQNNNSNDNSNYNGNENQNSNQNLNNNSNNNSNENDNTNENNNDNENDNSGGPKLELIRNLEIGETVNELEIDDEERRLYASTLNSVRIFSIIDEENPVQSGVYKSHGNIVVENIYGFDEYEDSTGRKILASAEGTTGARIVDVSDAENIEVLATIPKNPDYYVITDVLVRKRAPSPTITAVLGNAPRGFEVYNLDDSTNPQRIQEKQVGGGTIQFHRTTFGGSERIYALTNPWPNSEVITSFIVNSAGELEKVGGFSQAESPLKLGGIEDNFFYAFNQDETLELRASDNPVIDREIPNVRFMDAARSLSANTGFATAFAANSGVKVYNGLQETAKYDSGRIIDVVWKNDIVFASNSNGKVHVLRYSKGN